MAMDKILLADFLRQTVTAVPSVLPLLSDEARELVAVKATIKGEDLPTISATYNSAIVEILTGYFENGGSIAAPKNEFSRASNDAFNMTFDLGWQDGGGTLPIDGDALDWINARIDQEISFIKQLFIQAKDLRKEGKDFDWFAWVTERADGYSRTLREVWNTGKLMAMKDQMVTFDGDDGAESCPDCQKLKGKRHKISWFVNRNFVPPFGTGLECHPGRRCQHGLMNDKGEWITV